MMAVIVKLLKVRVLQPLKTCSLQNDQFKFANSIFNVKTAFFHLECSSLPNETAESTSYQESLSVVVSKKCA